MTDVANPSHGHEHRRPDVDVAERTKLMREAPLGA
jgi:hypothetical protein